MASRPAASLGRSATRLCKACPMSTPSPCSLDARPCKSLSISLPCRGLKKFYTKLTILQENLKAPGNLANCPSYHQCAAIQKPADWHDQKVCTTMTLCLRVLYCASISPFRKESWVLPYRSCRPPAVEPWRPQRSACFALKSSAG